MPSDAVTPEQIEAMRARGILPPIELPVQEMGGPPPAEEDPTPPEVYAGMGMWNPHGDTHKVIPGPTALVPGFGGDKANVAPPGVMSIPEVEVAGNLPPGVAPREKASGLAFADGGAAKGAASSGGGGVGGVGGAPARSAVAAPPAAVPAVRDTWGTGAGSSPVDSRDGVRRLLDEQGSIEKQTDARLKAMASGNLAEDKLREGRAAGETAKAKADKEAADKAFKDAATNPESYWGSKTTAQKIASGIALALGGFAAGFGRTENSVLRMVESDIAEHNAKNRSKAEALKEIARGKETDIEKMTADQKDARLAALAKHAADLEAVKAEMAKQAAGAPEAVKMREAQYRGQIEEGQKRAFAEDQAIRKTMSEVDKNEAEAGRIRAAGQGGGGPNERQIREDKKWIVDKLEAAGIPATEATVNKALADYEHGNVRGVNAVSNEIYERAPWAYKLIHGQQASESQQDWAAARNNIIKLMSGSGVSGSEMKRMVSQIDGAGDVESRRSALRNALHVVQQQKAIVGSAAPEAAARLGGMQPAAPAAPMPATVPLGGK